MDHDAFGLRNEKSKSVSEEEFLRGEVRLLAHVSKKNF